jgi:hypothetical protein
VVGFRRSGQRVRGGCHEGRREGCCYCGPSGHTARCGRSVATKSHPCTEQLAGGRASWCLRLLRPAPCTSPPPAAVVQRRPRISNQWFVWQTRRCPRDVAGGCTAGAVPSSTECEAAREGAGALLLAAAVVPHARMTTVSQSSLVTHHVHASQDCFAFAGQPRRDLFFSLQQNLHRLHTTP